MKARSKTIQQDSHLKRKKLLSTKLENKMCKVLIFKNFLVKVKKGTLNKTKFKKSKFKPKSKGKQQIFINENRNVIDILKKTFNKGILYAFGISI